MKIRITVKGRRPGALPPLELTPQQGEPKAWLLSKLRTAQSTANLAAKGLLSKKNVFVTCSFL